MIVVSLAFEGDYSNFLIVQVKINGKYKAFPKEYGFRTVYYELCRHSNLFAILEYMFPIEEFHNCNLQILVIYFFSFWLTTLLLFNLFKKYMNL